MENNLRPESMARITTIELANAFIEDQGICRWRQRKQG